MGFRFFKRIRIAPGLSINLSKSFPSLSIGPRGMKYTISPRGKRMTFGLPGTGLSYTTTSRWNNNPDKSDEAPSLDDGVLSGMFKSADERAFISGLKLFLTDQTDDAYAAFASNKTVIDSIFMHGFLSLGKGFYSEAEGDFVKCQNRLKELGRLINQCTKSFKLSLSVTEYIQASIDADERGLALAYVESLQKQGKFAQAMSVVSHLWNSNPSDSVICLSLCDLVVANPAATKTELEDVIKMTALIENDEPIFTNILYLRAAALFRMHAIDDAVTQLSGILRKKSGRPIDMMHQIRYLRARAFEQQQNTKMAEKDYRLIFTEDPQYKDVGNRLSCQNP